MFSVSDISMSLGNDPYTQIYLGDIHYAEIIPETFIDINTFENTISVYFKKITINNKDYNDFGEGKKFGQFKKCKK